MQSTNWLLLPPRSVVLDLDGVIWLAGQLIPGSDKAVTHLREEGFGILFATNNSAPTKATLLTMLSSVGIKAANDEIVSSGDAVANMLPTSSKVAVVGEAGLVEALEAKGHNVVGIEKSNSLSTCNVLVVGWTRGFNFTTLAKASALIRAGVEFIGTNHDPTYPTPEGLLPGAGSIIAAIEVASGTPAQFVGKPNQPFVQLLQDRSGEKGIAGVVGDRSSTDGDLAKALEVPFGLVLSGATSKEDAEEERHKYAFQAIAPNLYEIFR